ncbi:MAG: hypothetical protein Q9184_000123 [Pyrenodesmia sp. 2 TL-2023]
MPAMPNLDIPPSPPGSPSAGIEQKFDYFAKLKVQGVHFNEKLAASSALKNPALLRRLISSAGLDKSEQYATVLSKDLWDPSALPEWAYKDELAKSQQQIAKKHEDEKSQTQRESINFVPSASTERPVNSDDAISISKIKGSSASAAERVAAGLEVHRARTPYTSNGSFRGQLERRSGRMMESKPSSRRR